MTSIQETDPNPKLEDDVFREEQIDMIIHHTMGIMAVLNNHNRTLIDAMDFMSNQIDFAWGDADLNKLHFRWLQLYRPDQYKKDIEYFNTAMSGATL